jgi:hypothetical protein
MERAAAMNPAELRYRLRKIQILRALGGEGASPGRLDREYASALAWHPRNAFLLAEAARARDAAGDRDGAAALLERAVAAEPNFAWAKEELARLVAPADPSRAAALSAEGAAVRARYAGAKGLTPAEEKLVTFPVGGRAEPEGRGDSPRPGEP